MRSRWAPVEAAGALLCAALAAWVSLGALTFLTNDGRGQYVGVLPPIVWLVVFLGAAAAVASFARPDPTTVAPLWLTAVLLLPWLPWPVRVPVSVFMWTGALAGWIWTIAALAVALRLFAGRGALAALNSPSPIRSALFAGAIALVAYVACAWSVAPHRPDGDEPHYLIITQSLLKDHDIKIENNHRQGDYRAYFPRLLKPDFLKRSTTGEIYSIHAPGLPFIVTPGFALAGYPGVMGELALVSAAASALLWLLAWRLTGSGVASWFGWATFALTVPFLFHSTAVFPDGMGAVLMVVALLPLVDERGLEPAALTLAGAALAALPWLSSRYAALSAVAGAVIAVRALGRSSRRPARLLALASCPVVSAIAFFLFFQTIYGTPNPNVVYANAPTMRTAPSTLLRGVPGLFFDQQFGLLPNAPVYLCAFAGLALMIWRGARRLAIELLLISIPYFLIAASFTSWWGGTTAPARYFVPITPMLALAAAVWIARVDGAWRMLGTAALVVSVLISVTIAAVDRGAFVFNFRDGMSRVALWLSPGLDLTKALPSLFQNPPTIVLMQTAIWGAAIAGAVAAAVWAARSRRADTALVFGLTMELAAMVAVSLVWRTNHVAAVTPQTSIPFALRSYATTARESLVLGYRPFRRMTGDELLEALPIARASSDSARPQWPGTNHLPAGIYEITVWTAAPSSGRVRMATDRQSPPLQDWDLSEMATSWHRAVLIPVDVAGLRFDLDATARASIRDLVVRLRAILPRRARIDSREASRAGRYGSAAVYLLAGTASMEPGGIWVGGESSAEFAIQPADLNPVGGLSRSKLPLLVRNGAVENVAAVSTRSWHEEPFTLGPGRERLIDVPLADANTTILRVGSARGFRPADVDPKTDDARFLGVWLELR